MVPASTVKAVLLIAGPQKGTRFRPLSLDVPKPLFPVAGVHMLQHHVEALVKQIQGLKEILVLGFYTNAEMEHFVRDMTEAYKVPVRYLQEYTPLGTAGGIYHFRDRILSGDADLFFVLNGDVCADFPLADLLEFHRRGPPSTLVSMTATEATRQQAINYGCVAEDKADHTVLHYVEKPQSYVSSLVNCGIYLFSKDIFGHLRHVYKSRQYKDGSGDVDASYGEVMWIERDILPSLAGTGQARVFQTDRWWSQMKTAGSVIYANRHYLSLYKASHPERLTNNSSPGPVVIGNVFIHPTAQVHPTAVLGPNVSIGKNVTVGAGTRVKESIVMDNSTIGSHSLILYTVIGMGCAVGDWSRVEGTPNDPNPNKPFAKMENVPLFNSEGKLNPSITIIGCNVEIPSEIIVLNALVLPHKQIRHSFKNEIIL